MRSLWLAAVRAGDRCRATATRHAAAVAAGRWCRGVLFLLALVPRIWSNADLPYGIWFDEAQAGSRRAGSLTRAASRRSRDMYGRDASGFYTWRDAASSWRCRPGRGAASAALLGALNVPLVYLLGRELFGWRVGLAAGVLLAAQSLAPRRFTRSAWTRSRCRCATLAFWLLARAVRTGTSERCRLGRNGAWARVHGYTGFRVMPLLGAGCCWCMAPGVEVGRSAQPWRSGWRPRLRAGRAAGADLCGDGPDVLDGRLNQTRHPGFDAPFHRSWTELWTNVQKHALMFHVSGDMNGRHNIPGWPMLDPISGCLPFRIWPGWFCDLWSGDRCWPSSGASLP